MDTPSSRDVDQAAASAKAAARDAGDHPALRALARVGYAVSGVLHIVIAGIALQVAWGGGGGQADQSGALAAIGGTPFGAVLLWLMVLGFLALALWQITEVVSQSDLKDRGKAAAKAVLYGALAVTSVRFATGGGSSSSSEDSSQGFTATLMQQPAGRWLVGAVGLAVVAAGAAHMWKGATQGFCTDLVEDPGVAATGAGVVGYSAKGVALAVMGGLFVLAALQQQSEEASGLDGALKTLKEQPFGPYLLTLVALGLVAYGIYCFVRARLARL